MSERRRRPLIEADDDIPGPSVEAGIPASLRRPPQGRRQPSPPMESPVLVPDHSGEPLAPRIATVPVELLLALADASATAARCSLNLVALSADSWEELPREIRDDPEYVSLRRTLERTVSAALPGEAEMTRESWLVAASEAAAETRGEVAGIISEIEAWLRAGQVRRV